MPFSRGSTLAGFDRTDSSGNVSTYTIEGDVKLFPDQITSTNFHPLEVYRVIETEVDDYSDLSSYGLSSGDFAVTISQSSNTDDAYRQQTGNNTATKASLPDADQNYIFIETGVSTHKKAVYIAKTKMFTWIDCNHYSIEKIITFSDPSVTTVTEVFSSVPVPLDRYLEIKLTVTGRLLNGTTNIFKGTYSQNYHNDNGSIVSLSLGNGPSTILSSDWDALPAPTITFGSDTGIDITNASGMSGSSLVWFVRGEIYC